MEKKVIYLVLGRYSDCDYKFNYPIKSFYKKEDAEICKERHNRAIKLVCEFADKMDEKYEEGGGYFFSEFLVSIFFKDTDFLSLDRIYDCKIVEIDLI